jgi:hypothetical protein
MSTPSTHPPDQPSAVPPQPGIEPSVAGGPDGIPRPLPPLESDPAIRASTPPVILEAQDAFFRDLPEMLKEHEGQWVAYYGSKRIGFSKSKTALWLECERLGYQDFLVYMVYPYPEFDYISAL